MSILKNAKNRLTYFKNAKKANKLIQENNSLIDFYCTENKIIVPFEDRKKLNESGVISDKEIEYEKMVCVKEPLIVYLDGMTREQKRKMPPLLMRAKIKGPVALNPKYSNLLANFQKDSINTYMKKASELGINGRGRIVEIEYSTEDYDILDEEHFENFFRLTRMTEKDVKLSKRYVDSGWPLSYVHEIDESSESVEEFRNSLDGINMMMWNF